MRISFGAWSAAPSPLVETSTPAAIPISEVMRMRGPFRIHYSLLHS
jgi:hypothetical protein